MSDYPVKFVEHLTTLKERDRGALAALRHSLAFEPGTYPKAYPYVERFANTQWHARDGRRLALYAVAGLFARNPRQRTQSFAASLGELLRERESPSIELRFVALLGADAENIFDYLRHAVSLLAADEIGCDYAQLLKDLSLWMSPALEPARRDDVRQRWARDFYRSAHAETDTK